MNQHSWTSSRRRTRRRRKRRSPRKMRRQKRLLLLPLLQRRQQTWMVDHPCYVLAVTSIGNISAHTTYVSFECYVRLSSSTFTGTVVTTPARIVGFTSSPPF